ncbi:MAG: hypothetical protein Q9211_001886 [Gyalolechia sp. 1 TL-2023]
MASTTTFLTALLALLGAIQAVSSLPTMQDGTASVAKMKQERSSPSPYPDGFLDIFDQPTCSGNELCMPTVLNTTDCHKLHGGAEHIFIGWVPDFRSVTFYEDERCEKEVGKIEQPTSLDQEHGTCVHAKDFGKAVGSAKNTS